ncbi:glycosyltransferase [Streptomyces sp. GESEQ-35]|uniref:glycosyltransferase n=1 Tax=Streptomyces sp. GESEQ-35 TaxID=2812657 RepID=UPI001B3247AC|nr:glycosyltransferase [Streptomyces sp. GESEQ-35]
MSTMRGPLLVAVSGPDGSGKTQLVGRIATALRERGFSVATAHCYGCVLCRRFSDPPQVREGEWARRRHDDPRVGSWFRRAHALLDLTELAVRVLALRLLVRVMARGRPMAVVTDRGPLDGLTKFGPVPGSLIARYFTRLARRYHTTLLMEVSPSTLLARGWDPAAGPPAVWWARFLKWARRLPSVTPVNGDMAPSTLVATAIGLVLDASRSAGLAVDATDTRKRVVLSIFDDFCSPHYRGGGAVVVEKVARRLAEEYRVSVVTAARRGSVRAQDGIRYIRLPVCWAGPRAGQLLFQAMLPFTAWRVPHDLWLESFTPPFSTSLLPLFTRSPVVGIDQGRSGEALWRKYHIPFFLIERIGFRCYRDIVVMNEADADAVQRLSPRAAVHVIANGVERQHVEEGRIGKGDYILFLGRIDIWQKGLDLLLKAYAHGRPPMPLVLAGAGTESEERKLDELLASETRDISRVGRAEEQRKRELLQHSAVVVLPSRHETFGLVALEGMSYGKPVLHFDLPALRWMRGGGDVAVTPFDVDLMGDRMRELASDASLRRSLGRKALLASQRYTWDEMSSRYLSLVRRLLNSPAATGRRARRGGMP